MTSQTIGKAVLAAVFAFSVSSAFATAAFAKGADDPTGIVDVRQGADNVANHG